MKKSETMDLYEGLNEISPQMIEEAGNYKKTASVDIRYKKSNNVKKIIAKGLVAAAGCYCCIGSQRAETFCDRKRKPEQQSTGIRADRI